MKRRITLSIGLALVPALVLAGCGSDPETSPDTTPPLAPELTGATFDDGLVGVWWRPNTEPDLAGYYLYLIEDGVSRQANFEPIHDNYIVIDPEAAVGAVQVYVTAMDFSGNESSPSDTMRPIDQDLNDTRQIVGGVPRDF